MSYPIYFLKPTYTELLHTWEMGKRQLAQCMKEYGKVFDEIEEERFFFWRGNCVALAGYVIVGKNNKDLAGWDGEMGTMYGAGDVVKLYQDSSGNDMVKVCSFYYGSEE